MSKRNKSGKHKQGQVKSNKDSVQVTKQTADMSNTEESTDSKNVNIPQEAIAAEEALSLEQFEDNVAAEWMEKVFNNYIIPHGKTIVIAFIAILLIWTIVAWTQSSSQSARQEVASELFAVIFKQQQDNMNSTDATAMENSLLADLKTINERHPDVVSPEIASMRYRILFEKGEYAEAKSVADNFIKKAKSNNPMIPIMQLASAKASMEVGNLDDAQQILKFLVGKPGIAQTEARIALAQLYELKGNYQDSVSEYVNLQNLDRGRSAAYRQVKQLIADPGYLRATDKLAEETGKLPLPAPEPEPTAEETTPDANSPVLIDLTTSEQAINEITKQPPVISTESTDTITATENENTPNNVVVTETTTETTEKAAEQKAADDKAADDKAEADDEKADDEKAAAEQKAADDKAAAEKAAAEQKAADDKAAAEKAAAEQKAADDKAAAEKLLAEKLAAEKAAARKALEEKFAAEKAAAEKALAEKFAAEKAAAEKALEEKLTANPTLSASELAKQAIEATTTPTAPTDTDK